MTKRKERLERGRDAEILFRDWLNASGLAYIATDQTPLTVPKRLRGDIKRPDFLVGLPTIGTIAFEVKSKTVYGDCLVFDTEERRRLLNFQRCFNITVWFACFDPDDPRICRLFLNDFLFDDIRGDKRLDRDCVHLPICDTYQIDICTKTLFDAITQSIDHY